MSRKPSELNDARRRDAAGIEYLALRHNEVR